MGAGEAWAGAGAGGDVTAPSARDTGGVEVPPRPVTTTAGAGGGGALTSDKVAFRSKVVSRAHAEFWAEAGGQVCDVSDQEIQWEREIDRYYLFASQFYVRDTRSSSGTFLNHIRLSNPTQESRPFAIKVSVILFG
jgi:pSer/pThr/pTyr-binding forkhead associated (FHA) protein